jgi:hypothetical protein
MAGVALIFNTIAASNQALNRRLDALSVTLNDLQRETAIVSLRLLGDEEN